MIVIARTNHHRPRDDLDGIVILFAHADDCAEAGEFQSLLLLSRLPLEPRLSILASGLLGPLAAAQVLAHDPAIHAPRARVIPLRSAASFPPHPIHLPSHVGYASA
jgi:hypothetical protein